MSQFRDGDNVKFQVLGIVPEQVTANFPLRQRTYLAVDIFERNGEPTVPTRMEIGFYNDEFKGVLVPQKDGALQIERDDLVPERLWQSQLTSGIARMTAANVGEWSTLIATGFIVAESLKGTNEPIPPGSMPFPSVPQTLEA